MGNLVQILTARRLQHAGHTPYALVGGATGMIGDPKDSGERILNSARHGQGLGRAGPPPDRAVPVLRGRRTPRRWSTTTTGPRACRRSTSCATSASTSRSTGCSPATSCAAGSRPGISYTEFSYVLLQSMDFLNLYRDHGVDAAVRRLRPVGQHHRRRRADPARRRRPRARVRDAAGHQGRRHQVRQDRGRRALARPGDDVAVRLLPVLAQRRGREGRRAAADLHLPLPRGDRGARGRQTAEKPFLRAGQKALAEHVTTLVHGAEETEQIQAAAAALFGGGDLAGAERGDPRRRAARGRVADACRARSRRTSTCWSRPAWRKSRGEARRTIAEGGAYLNNERVEDPELVPGDERPHRRLVAGAAPRQEELRRRRGDPDLNSGGGPV